MVTETEVMNLRSKVNELEERINFLYTKLGIAYGSNISPVDPRILDFIRQGNKIQAIKIYREVTGVGLAEAKDAVDQIERSM